MEINMRITDTVENIPEISKAIAETLAVAFSSLKIATTHPFKPLPCLLVCIPSEKNDGGKSYKYFAYELAEDKDKVNIIDLETSPFQNQTVDGNVSYFEGFINSRHPEYQQGQCGLFSADPLRILDSVTYIFGLILNEKEYNYYFDIANLIIPEIKDIFEACLPKYPNPLDALKKTKEMIGEEYRILEIAKNATMNELGWYYYSLFDLYEGNKGDIHRIHCLGKNLYLLCHKISVKRLESEECKGSLVFTPEDNATIDIPLIKLSSTDNLIRKFLPLTSENKAILCNNQEIYGIGSIKDRKAGYIEIVFISHGCWNIYYYDKILKASFRYGYLQYQPHVDSEQIEQHLNRICGDRFIINHELVRGIIVKAITQKHGTTLVFHKTGKDEAKRLSRRGCLTNLPINCGNLDLLNNMIAIDGAMMFDFDLTCHAIGLILDGKVTLTPETGDKARGARYNSALTYIENNKDQAFAIVVSEDGMVNFFPDSE